MKIVKLSVLRGANVFSYKPVLWIKLSLGSHVDIPSSQIKGFTERLTEFLPGLHEHQCSVGHPGGFVERLHEGTYLAHIFEHVVLELQNCCGDKVGYGKARATDQPDIYDVIAAYQTECVALRCAYLAERLLNHLIEGKPFAFETEMKKLRELYKEMQLGPSAEAVYQSALARKIPVVRFAGEDLLTLGQGKHMKRVWSTVTEDTSLLAADLVGNKYLTTKLLAEHGVSVPENGIAETEDEAMVLFRQFNGVSVVVKPLDGSHGRGVTIDIDSEGALRNAFRLAQRYSDRVLVEQYVSGRQYRLCVVNHRLVAASERLPAYVIGDGQHTVEELVAFANRNPLRGDGHDKPLTKIIIDEVSEMILTKQELAPHIVPEAKRIVQIKETANISTGGTAVDVTALVHPDNIALAERVSKIVGLDIAGLDVIAADIAKPLAAQNGAIIEVNAAPGIRMHHHPSAGQARDVGGKIIDYLFPEGDGRIPVVAVTGTNGKTTATRMIGSIFRQAGYNVGMSTTEGVYLNERRLLAGDCSGPMSAKMVLGNQEVEVAVLETARGGIVRAGLGFDACDVGVVTNISEDHLGQDGIETLEDLAHVKSLVLEVVKVTGTAVINADDIFAPKLAHRVQSSIVYFSAETNNMLIRRHLGMGGKAVFVKNNKVYLAEGASSEAILRVEDMPVTLGGRAQHNIENALVAIAATYGYGLEPQVIKKGLEGFSHNLGRMNLFSIRDFKVCIDYGHNLAGYQAVIRTARRMDAKRLVGVIAAPGDRRDDIIFHIGETAGCGFDQLYIKEDADQRGRRPGEIASLLENGAISAGFDQARINTVLAEGAAVRMALDDAREGDLIIVFYECYDTVMEVLQKFVQECTQDDTVLIAQPVLPYMVDEETHLLKNLYL